MKLHILNKNGKMQIHIHYREQPVSLPRVNVKPYIQLWWIQITWELFYNLIGRKLVEKYGAFVFCNKISYSDLLFQRIHPIILNLY